MDKALLLGFDRQSFSLHAEPKFSWMIRCFQAKTEGYWNKSAGGAKHRFLWQKLDRRWRNSQDVHPETGDVWWFLHETCAGKCWKRFKAFPPFQTGRNEENPSWFPGWPGTASRIFDHFKQLMLESIKTVKQNSNGWTDSYRKSRTSSSPSSPRNAFSRTQRLFKKAMPCLKNKAVSTKQCLFQKTKPFLKTTPCL